MGLSGVALVLANRHGGLNDLNYINVPEVGSPRMGSTRLVCDARGVGLVIDI